VDAALSSDLVEPVVGDRRRASSLQLKDTQQRRTTRRQRMTARERFTVEEARHYGQEVGIHWSSAPFNVEEFRAGMNVELEHGRADPSTDVTHDDPLTTARIALAHLNEFPDYYTRLRKMEQEAEQSRSG
jgi:hypothetical protein